MANAMSLPPIRLILGVTFLGRDYWRGPDLPAEELSAQGFRIPKIELLRDVSENPLPLLIAGWTVPTPVLREALLPDSLDGREILA